MYPNLFAAWYCLGILVLCLGTFLILLPFIGIERACGSIGFLGLLGFLPIFTMTRFRFFRNEKFAERDLAFLEKALLVGFSGAVGMIYGVSSILDSIVRHWMGSDSISLNLFWLPGILGVIVGSLMFSVQLLLLYYKGDMPLWKGDCRYEEGGVSHKQN